MSSNAIIAIDNAYLGPRFGVLTGSGVITTFEVSRFQLDYDHLTELAKKYQTRHFILTGPGTEFLPLQNSEFTFEKKSRIDMLAQGIHFTAEVSPALVVLFEVGCHLFYHGKETLYLGSLPYTFSSFGLKEDILVSAEMGQSLPDALAICSTHVLPQSRVQDRYETLLAYTIALGIKEFQSRYTISNIEIIGNVTKEQRSLLHQFLNSELGTLNAEEVHQSSDLRVPSSELRSSPHLAIFGMLSPYIANHAGEN